MDSHRILADFFKKTWPIYVLSICCHLVANMFHVNFPRVLGHFTDDLQDGLLSAGGIASYSWTLLGIGVGFAVMGGSANTW